jgi:hypothetical protein
VLPYFEHSRAFFLTEEREVINLCLIFKNYHCFYFQSHRFLYVWQNPNNELRPLFLLAYKALMSDQTGMNRCSYLTVQCVISAFTERGMHAESYWLKIMYIDTELNK